MRFTAAQYDAAIEALTTAKGQLAPDGQCCHICGDSGHMAWECGHNPLFAMGVCEDLVASAIKTHKQVHAVEEKMNDSDQSEALADWHEEAHELLHYLAGYDSHFGRQVGPARVMLPDGLVP